VSEWDEPVVVEEGTYGSLGRHVESGSDDGPRPSTEAFCARKAVTPKELKVAQLAAQLSLKGQPVEALIAQRIPDWRRQVVVMHLVIRINNDQGWVCVRRESSRIEWTRLQTASVVHRGHPHWRGLPGGIDNPIPGAAGTAYDAAVERRRDKRRKLHIEQLHALRDKLGRVPTFTDYSAEYGGTHSSIPRYWQSEDAPTQAEALNVMWRAAGMQRPKHSGWMQKSEERTALRLSRQQAKESA
jgi:hypothetical protein